MTRRTRPRTLLVTAGLLAALVAATAGAGGSLVRASDGPSPFAAGSGTGGPSWEPRVTVRPDTGDAFNDRESFTADPTDPTGRRVYVTWDRLEGVGIPLQDISPLPLLPLHRPARF